MNRRHNRHDQEQQVGGALVTADHAPGAYAAIQRPAEEFDLLVRENLGGQSLSLRDLVKIKIAMGGATQFVVPGPEGDESVPVVEGIIVAMRDIRKYYATAPDQDGAPRDPDCRSEDAITGVGDPGGTCRECPLAQFADGRPPTCKAYEGLFLLRPETLLPDVFLVPPTSATPLNRYLRLLINRWLRPHQVVTRFSLERHRGGGNRVYSRLVVTSLGTLPPEDLARVEAYRSTLEPVFRSPFFTTTPDTTHEVA